MIRADTADYSALFLRDTPLLDTRSPVEFAAGAFPTAVNLPLMSDEERRQVGICYKQHGQRAAIELGHRLVAGDVRARRIERWCQFARENPEGYLYCFRGGLRSATVREWLCEAGVDYPLVEGGYKAMRRFLLESLEQTVTAGGFLLVAGKTGSGKTRVIDAVPGAIDLEGLAKHRGSSFGRLLDEQPSQIDFENALAVSLLRLIDRDDRTVLLEDEGRLIGRISLPSTLREKMQRSPLLVVEESLVSRVSVIVEDYIDNLGARYRNRYGSAGDLRHRQHLGEGLERIKKRLGGTLYARIDQLLREAFSSAQPETAEELHRQWIELLLVEYYDPMYEYQMSKREGRIIARGTRLEIIERARDALSL